MIIQLEASTTYMSWLSPNSAIISYSLVRLSAELIKELWSYVQYLKRFQRIDRLSIERIENNFSSMNSKAIDPALRPRCPPTTSYRNVSSPPNR